MSEKVNVVEQLAQRMAVLEKKLGEAVAAQLQEFYRDTGVTFEELSLDIRVIRTGSPTHGHPPKFSVSFNDYENDLDAVLNKARREYNKKPETKGREK